MILRGKAFYAKVLGKPAPGYNEGEFEWSIDVALDEKAKAKYLEAGGDEFYIKPATNPKTGKTHPSESEHLQFRRKSVKQDGSPSKPITVVDSKGRPWDETQLIGNGSIINVKYALNEITAGKAKRMKPGLIAIQVVEHVAYERDGDGEYEDFPIEGSEDWSND